MTMSEKEALTWRRAHPKPHLLDRQGWLRAAVMGANDGLLSTASLIIGVASGGAGEDGILLAGVAGAVAGALSMAAGEYVAVASQSDLEQSDIDRERRELSRNPDGEAAELEAIYRARGLSPRLAAEVAAELMAEDALGAHLRDEVGLVDENRAKPLQAALVSAGAFCAGAAAPIVVASVTPLPLASIVVGATAMATLAILGALGAYVGGAPRGRAAVRVAVIGALAMALSAGVGGLVGAAL